MKIGIFGQQGAGKTLLAMFYARWIQSLDQSITIYTNVQAEGNNIRVISDFGNIPLDRSPKILVIDEAMFTIDSRSSSSKNNKIYSRLLALFRKTNFIAVFYCTHRLGMIDVNFREQLDYITMCRKGFNQFEYLIIDMVSYIEKPFFLKRSQELYNFVNYDTYDFPLPIDIQLLQESKLFQIQK